MCGQTDLNSRFTYSALEAFYSAFRWNIRDVCNNLFTAFIQKIERDRIPTIIDDNELTWADILKCFLNTLRMFIV